jgi:hypothetical protein
MKQSRYRQKNVSQGKCPHCGKPCLPYYECEYRRSMKKMQRILRRMAGMGMIGTKNMRGKPTTYRVLDLTKSIVEYQTKDGDSRRFPRIGKQYIDIGELAIQCLNGKALDEDVLTNVIIQQITEIKIWHRVEEG